MINVGKYTSPMNGRMAAAQVWCWEKLFKLPMAKLALKVYLRPTVEAVGRSVETPGEMESG